MKIKAILSAIGLGIAGLVAFFFAASKSGASKVKARMKAESHEKAESHAEVEANLDAGNYEIKYRDGD